ncbi:sensor histidine kinase [Jidongwangia harbinensis]|uniref:sensor histidine kinase n=1 Tax=Jidongwangia harbinensis TaxID=2878561 RepID=UPI001CD9536A|nr:HAMP domain-containing sensor histidine kinase [Jidongwangia harbinensis]MCA2214181.1 HAMP domain-containing histidine kinase [Jidongwangia harbinensis]
MSRFSLRARLLAIGLALLTTGVLATNAVAIGYLRGHLVDRVDTQLTLLGTILQRFPVQVADRLPPEYTRTLDTIDEIYVVELTPTGQPVRVAGTAAAAGSSSGTPPLPTLDAAAVRARGQRPFTVDGWRMIVGKRVTGDNAVLVAARLTAVDSAVRRMWMLCALTIAAVLTLLTVVGWFAVQAGLRPLRRIQHTAAAIAAGDLSHRVPELAPPRTEVGRLAASLNGMLGQLEAAFAARARSEDRMRAFLSDVSHEVRTPLFGIRGFAQLYRMGGLPERADVDRTMRHIERESTRLASLAEDLLLLARLDEVGVAHRSPMDLRTLAADAYAEVQALDPARPVTLTGPDGGPPESAPVIADEARLRQVMTNLVANAVAHTPAGTPVRIGVGTVGGDAVLELADRGPGLDDEQAARVFDRFYRVDASRSRDNGGTGAGLGLAIARSIVAAHGGRVELRTAPGAGATFRVLLPRP